MKPPAHHPSHPRHLLHLRAQCIDKVTVQPIRYGFLGWIPKASIASSTAGYSHSPPALHFAVIPMIRLAARLRNAVRTLSISLVTTYLLLPYNSTNCAIDLYISTWAYTVSLVLSSTLAIMPHRFQALCRLGYTAAQLMLLNAIVCPRYINAYDSGGFLALIWNETLLALKQRFRVLRLRCLSSP